MRVREPVSPASAMSLDRAGEQQRTLALAVRRAALTTDELWTRYVALGGKAEVTKVDEYVRGLAELPAEQRDVLAHAVNDRLDELDRAHRASYSRTVEETRPRDSASLNALVTLLERAELAPPDRLPAIAEAAGRALGARITVYLVDFDQRYLHPVPAHDASPEATEPLQVGTTMAGRAFRQVRTLRTSAVGRPRLWVPLLDGVERLGVLEVEVSDAVALQDPDLAVQCGRVSMLLGHLVVLLSQYGDALDIVRLQKRRTAAGELIWSLLPPLTAGVDGFVVTGVLEPCYDVGGDAFDYSLSETTATLMLMDAVGHDLRSGLVAATALAAHRSARHAGHGLARASDHDRRNDQPTVRPGNLRHRRPRRGRPRFRPAALRQRGAPPSLAHARGKDRQTVGRRAPATFGTGPDGS